MLMVIRQAVREAKGLCCHNQSLGYDVDSTSLEDQLCIVQTKQLQVPVSIFQR